MLHGLIIITSTYYITNLCTLRDNNGKTETYGVIFSLRLAISSDLPVFFYLSNTIDYAKLKYNK